MPQHIPHLILTGSDIKSLYQRRFVDLPNLNWYALDVAFKIGEGELQPIFAAFPALCFHRFVHLLRLSVLNRYNLLNYYKVAHVLDCPVKINNRLEDRHHAEELTELLLTPWTNDRGPRQFSITESLGVFGYVQQLQHKI